MATPSFKHILVIGGTSGIGEAFVRRYHAQGRKVIATGRRAEKLDELKRELSGLATYQMDVNDLERFQSDTKKILAEHDTVDTVIMMSGIQNKAISTEITTNLTAPCVLAQTLVPHFASLKTPTNIVLVSSGLAFIPLPFFPVYNATKGGIHNFALSLRGQLADTPINIIELAPPYVATELDVGHRDALNTATQGKGHPPMPLDEYTESAMQKLDERVDGKPLKEITVGFSEMGAGAWRKAFDPIIQGMGMSAM